MKVIAALCWYDEQPSFLAATIASLKGFADHLVAVDGAYFLYPQGKPASDLAQRQVILEACYGAGIGCTLHTPASVYLGNEVEKRNLSIQLALAVAESDDDWIFVIDADEVVTSIPFDTLDRLAATDLDVAGVSLWNRWPQNHMPAELAKMYYWPREETMLNHRVIFRALGDFRIEGAHYVYKGHGEKLLRFSGSAGRQEPCLDLNDFKIEHRHDYRFVERNAIAHRYYERRDEYQIEKPPSGRETPAA